MPKGIPKRVPTRQQRALSMFDRQNEHFIEALNSLTPAEYNRYGQLRAEAGYPSNMTDLEAILERAKAHVANQALAD